MSTSPFWEQKTLDEMDETEWESLCDGCGRCCLHKLEDDENGELYFTNIACKLLDINNCRCTNYDKRFEQVPDCLSLRHNLPLTSKWLPTTCAYRLLYEGEQLPDWHPLISNDPESVKQAGMSVRYFAQKEEDITGDYQEHIIDDL